MAADATDFKLFGKQDVTGAGGGGENVDGASPLAAYNMSHKNRGVCVIINQKKFDFSRTGQNPRDGTDVDANKAEGTFRRLGYDVRRFTDLKAIELVRVLTEVGNEDHSENDSFVCVILSHGLEGRIFGYDGTVAIDRLTRCFRGDQCPTLVGKPKLFFFQACRGTRFDPGVEKDQADAIVGYGDNAMSTKLPIEADFLMAYSTVPGYYSWRNNQDGSWFMQSLCRVFGEYAGQGIELMHMMTAVNRLVATSYESCTDQEWTDGMKQMPSIVSMLTKLLYFKRPRH